VQRRRLGCYRIVRLGIARHQAACVGSKRHAFVERRHCLRCEAAFGEQQRHAQLAFRGAEYFRASGQTLAPLFGCRRGQAIGAEQLLPLTR
jgi:hypothetical protein